MTGAGDTGPGVAAGVGEAEVPPYDADALWAQASTVAGYGIKSEHPTALVQVVNGDLVKLDALVHGPFACDERHEILYRETPAELRARAKRAEDAISGWIKTYTGILSREREERRAIEARLAAAERERDEARAENDRLRTLLADGPGPCAYCGLAAADMARCAHGFPGCGRADDMTPPECPDQAEVDRSGDCALAAALDPPPRGATGPSGTRDGQGPAADGGEGGGGAAHG